MPQSQNTNPPEYKIIPVEKQPRTVLYEMSMRFKCDVGLKSVDGLLCQCFPNDGVPRVKDALTIRLHQVVPFIPDIGALAKYAEALRESYQSNGHDIAIDGIRFDGYDYLYAVEPDTENQKAVENTENQQDDKNTAK